MKPILLAIMIFVSATFVSAQAATSEGTAAAIRALEQEWTTGQSHNDNAALDLIFDNALIYVEYGNLVSKSEYLSRVKHSDPLSDQIELQPMSIRIFGHTAIAVGVYAEKQMRGSKHELRRWRFIDTWVYKKNGWVLVAAGSSPIMN
ncbi:MAG TPA: nuclear transport factor 2 family protein [Candidatus Sulfotelmatobacter sp.]|jgi:hypothetical protein